MGKRERAETQSAETQSGEADAAADGRVDLYETQLAALSPIAHPLAPKKMNKRLLKTVKRAAGAKHVRRGVKEVVKALRKGEKGLVVLAGDISPVDVISHIPVLCEDNQVPYLFTPSKESLGLAGATKRPTSCIMIIPGGKKKDLESAKSYLESFQTLSEDALAMA